MGESNTFGGLKHYDENHVPKVTVEERRLKAQRRVIPKESVAQPLAELQVEGIVLVPHGALNVVGRSTNLLPQFAIPEIHASVVRGVDVAGPKQANVAVSENMLRCGAP